MRTNAGSVTTIYTEVIELTVISNKIGRSFALAIESLRKSRTSRMRLLGIAQNYKVFAVFPLCFREFNAPSSLCDTVLPSSKWVSG
jgi:hypothetical protein